jgi:hypothetical protein
MAGDYMLTMPRLVAGAAAAAGLPLLMMPQTRLWYVGLLAFCFSGALVYESIQHARERKEEREEEKARHFAYLGLVQAGFDLRRGVGDRVLLFRKKERAEEEAEIGGGRVYFCSYGYVVGNMELGPKQLAVLDDFVQMLLRKVKAETVGEEERRDGAPRIRV